MRWSSTLTRSRSALIAASTSGSSEAMIGVSASIESATFAASRSCAMIWSQSCAFDSMSARSSESSGAKRVSSPMRSMARETSAGRCFQLSGPGAEVSL